MQHLWKNGLLVVHIPLQALPNPLSSMEPLEKCFSECDLFLHVGFSPLLKETLGMLLEVFSKKKKKKFFGNAPLFVSFLRSETISLPHGSDETQIGSFKELRGHNMECPKHKTIAKWMGFQDYSEETGPQCLPCISDLPGHILTKGSLALKEVSNTSGETPAYPKPTLQLSLCDLRPKYIFAQQPFLISLSLQRSLIQWAIKAISLRFHGFYDT